MTLTRLQQALEYAAAHGTNMTQTANALGITPNALSNYVTIARRRGETVEFPKAQKRTSAARGSANLQRALDYSQRHGTTMTETARALNIEPNALNCAAVRARKAGVRVEWGAVHRDKPEDAKPAPRPVADPSGAPLDLIRHVRNGQPFWERAVKPLEGAGSGPSAPVYPAPCTDPERHHTVAGIAWRLDIRPAIVELARRLREYPTHMTDAEALDLARDLGVSSPTVGA